MRFLNDLKLIFKKRLVSVLRRENYRHRGFLLSMINDEGFWPRLQTKPSLTPVGIIKPALLGFCRITLVQI